MALAALLVPNFLLCSRTRQPGGLLFLRHIHSHNRNITEIMSQTDRIQEKGLSEERGSERVQEGDHVAWKWGAGARFVGAHTCDACEFAFTPPYSRLGHCRRGMSEGEVQGVHPEKVTEEVKPGTSVTRKGSKDNPAVVIDRNGQTVLKKQSELYKEHKTD